MSDPPLFEIDFKNKTASVSTAHKVFLVTVLLHEINISNKSEFWETNVGKNSITNGQIILLDHQCWPTGDIVKLFTDIIKSLAKMKFISHQSSQLIESIMQYEFDLNVNESIESI